MDLNPDGVSFDNASLVVGDRVRVVKGGKGGRSFCAYKQLGRNCQ